MPLYLVRWPPLSTEMVKHAGSGLLTFGPIRPGSRACQAGDQLGAAQFADHVAAS